MIEEFYKGKRVLITGHTGFKGSWLCQVLLEMKANICGIALEPSNDYSLFNLLGIEKQIESNIVDIRDFESIKKIIDSFRPQIVIHLAAQPLVLESYENPRYTYEVNVMGTVNLCECIRLSGYVKSFVNVTTDKVYENKEVLDYEYNEEDILNGHDPYSNSKSCSELVTQSYIKSFFKGSNVAVSTCRAGNVIGGGDFADNRIIVDCVKKTLMNETIELRSPKSVRPYQHVLEADMFYLKLAMEQYEDGEIQGHYNVGPCHNDCITTEELVKLFCQKWGEKAKYAVLNSNGPHEANFLQLNCDKAKEKLMWQPQWDVDIAVSKVVEWSKEFKNSGEVKEVTKKQIKEYLEGMHKNEYN